jgi:hypothetical protein
LRSIAGGSDDGVRADIEALVPRLSKGCEAR